MHCVEEELGILAYVTNLSEQIHSPVSHNKYFFLTSCFNINRRKQTLDSHSVEINSTTILRSLKNIYMERGKIKVNKMNFSFLQKYKSSYYLSI